MTKDKYLLANIQTGAVHCEYLDEQEVTERKASGFIVTSIKEVSKAIHQEAIETMVLMKTIVEQLSDGETPLAVKADPNKNWFCIADPKSNKQFSISILNGSARLRVRIIGDEEVVYEKLGLSLNSIVNYIKAQQKA